MLTERHAHFCFAGNRPPEKPKFQRDQSAARAFDGTVVARHTAADGSAEYVHLVFGSDAYSQGQGANIVDAEFLFLKGRLSISLRVASIMQMSRPAALFNRDTMLHTISTFLCPQVTTLLT